MGREPQRRCVGCGRVAPKRSLLRWVADGERPVADPQARRAGRGAYTCRTRRCVEQAVRRGSFNRAFRRAMTTPAAGENVHLDEE
ncbi:MAG TPA: YlxR family protein [Conexibacter sp.]